MDLTPPSIHRRQFLTAGAALAAAPIARALPLQESKPGTQQQPEGAAPQEPAEEPIRVGVIGIGIRGRNLMTRSLIGKPGVLVTAVCDVDRNRRLDAKRRVDEAHGLDCVATDRHEEVMARDDVDAVLIATPDHWHTHQIIDACVAGKDVYCEKPLTLTLRESQLVIAAARKHGVVFQTGSQQRTEFGQRFVRAAEAVRAGRIGKVMTVHVGVGDAPVWCDLPGEAPEPGLDWDRWLGPAPERAYNEILSPRGVHGHYPQWRSYREYAGGGLADMGAHHFDIAQWALGMDRSGPVRVVPPSDPGSKRGATLVYGDGVRLVHGGPSGATFIGEKGMIAVDRGRISSVPGNVLEWEAEGEERLPRHEGHVANWLRCIRDRSTPICDVEIGARSAAICHLMNIAYWHREEVTWDPEAWRFEEEGANAWVDYSRRSAYGLPGF